MNIAEILKYCPIDTELYSSAFGKLKLINISSLTNIISVQNIHGTPFTFYSDGSYTLDGECVLFPSKDQRDWNKFKLPVKKGDIMMLPNGNFLFISNGVITKEGGLEYICGTIERADRLHISGLNVPYTIWTNKFCIPASEEAKKKLFDKIAEAGYRWNADTLELEKIEPKFKEGDVIIDNQSNLCLVSKIRDDSSVTIAATLYANKALNVFISNNVNRCIQLVTIASTTDRNKLYSAITRKGYKYDKEQHKLVKQKFKPFDKVLVRDDDTDSWEADIYLGYDEGKPFPYICTRAAYSICISYEGNEYLLDTIDSPTCVNRKE